MECDTPEESSKLRLVHFLEECPTKFRAQETAVKELLELDKVQKRFYRFTYRVFQGFGMSSNVNNFFDI